MDSCILFQRKEGWFLSDAVQTFGKLYLHFNEMLHEVTPDNEVESEYVLQMPPGATLDVQLKIYQRKMAIALIDRIEPVIKPLLEFRYLESPYVHHYLSVALDPKYEELKYPFMTLHAANISGGRQLARRYDEDVILPLLAKLKGVNIRDNSDETAASHSAAPLQNQQKAAQNSTHIECFTMESESPQERERTLLFNELMAFRREPFDESKDTRSNWLSTHATKYPTVVSLAKHLLSIPPTQIDNERIFSLAGRIASPLRSSISTQNIDNLVCIARSYPDAKLDEKPSKAYWKTLEEFSDYLITVETPEDYENEVEV